MGIFLVVCSKKVYLRTLYFSFSVMVFNLSSQWQAQIICMFSKVKKKMRCVSKLKPKIQFSLSWTVGSLTRYMTNSAPTSLENSDLSNQTCLLLMGQCQTDIAFLCLVQLLKKENNTTSTGILPNEISADCTVVRWTRFPTASQNLKWLQLVQVMSEGSFSESILKSKLVPTRWLIKETFHFREGANCCVFPTG